MSKTIALKLPILLAVFAILWHPSALAQGGRTVTGTALDASSGEPLVGAYVSLVGSRNVGAMTDLDGVFSLLLPASVGDDAKLLIESVGYEDTEFSLASLLSTGKVAVKVKSELLDEVVVVGYGVQKKVSSVGSITQTKGEDLLRVGNISTVSEAIQGQMPGVIAVSTRNLGGAAGDNRTHSGTNRLGKEAIIAFVAD